MVCGSTLAERSPLGGVGDVTRCGGSRLFERRCRASGMLFGSAGTGGAFTAGETARLRAGDWPRKVRSLIELLGRVSEADRAVAAPPRLVVLRLLLMEETDPRRTIRFVCRLPMGSGVVLAERKAAAAAAEESGVAVVLVWYMA